MRIVIDMQGAQTDSRFRGIGRYTLSLAQAIVRNRGEHEVILALSGLFPDTIEPIRAAFEGLLPQENIRVWYAPGPVRECEGGNAPNREAAELIREAFLKNLKPDIIHISSLFEGYVDDALTSIGAFDQTTPTVVTLYDLIPLLNPEHYLRPNPAYEHYYLRKIENLKRASAWLGISDFSVKDGCKTLVMETDRVFNISSACDPKFRPIEISAEAETKLRQRYDIDRPFVLYTGGGDARKNIHRLVRAYAQLPEQLRKEYQLTLAGQLSGEEVRAISEAAKTAGLKKDELIFTAYVSDEDLVQLYNLCALFVFPSWYEGFGLPALEAMSCGAPVIAASTSSLPEVIDWPEALFDPYAETAIAAKILQALTDEVFCAKLVGYGLERAKEFSWDASAKRALAAFEQVHNNHQRSSLSVTPSTRRPKLAYISPLPPERSGIADYSAELLPELMQHYDIDVIVAQDSVSDTWVNANCPQRSVEWFRANASMYDRVLYHFGNSIFHQHMFSLLNEVPGVIVLHDFFLGNVACYMDSVGYQPGMWTEALYCSHGYAGLQERFNSPDIDKVIWKYPCNLSVLQRAEAVIVHSAHSIDLAKQWYGKLMARDWNVIPLLRQPVGETDKSSAREKIGLTADDFIICSFGLLDPAKQNHRLLDAWLSSELAQNEHCHLIFVGQNHGGDYGAQLLSSIGQSGLAQRIHITGWVDVDTYRNYLEAADVAVQLRALSRGETSAAVLDCMNYGLPTIVNESGSMAELPDDGVWKLPEFFDDAELKAALETFWRDASGRQRMGSRAQEIIRTQHAPQFCAERYAQTIEKAYLKPSANIALLVEGVARVAGLPEKPATLMHIAEAAALSVTPKQPIPQLLIDVSALAHADNRTGIQRVVRSILQELLTNPPEGFRIEPVYATMTQGYRYARRFTLNFLNCPETALQDEPVEFNAGDMFLGLDFEPYVVRLQRDFYQKLRNAGVQVRFVVYDLLPVLLPNVFPEISERQHQAWLKVVAEVDGAICISKAVASELELWISKNETIRARPFKIDWFHLGADVENSAPTRGLPKNAEQTLAKITARPSFLMVGTIEPRKGYLQTLEAFTLLWQSGLDINLVIVGNEGWKVLPDNMRRTIPRTIKKLRGHPELGKRLFWLEDGSDEYLEKIYAASTCLIAASEGEGFGLPLIEAAQHGLPIIARDIPVFREVAQQNAFYFGGLTAPELADSVRAWLDINLKGEAPLSTKMQWNTWKQAAKKLFTLMTVSDVKQKAMDEHLNLIHAARIAMVSTLLPQGDYILDSGGANCPLYKMGYPHHFKKLTLIDLPPDKRHDYYKDVVIDSNCPLGPVVVRYTDMTTLEGIADESVDFVWSGESIEHVPLEAGERMCREAFRVLKKGGAFCLDTPNRRLTEIHTATIGGGFIHPEHYIEYQPELLMQLLKAAGFMIENSYGICEMPETLATGEFHYEDFMFGKQITDRVSDGYIQFFKCVRV